jgi:hypothetical protein
VNTFLVDTELGIEEYVIVDHDTYQEYQDVYLNDAYYLNPQSTMDKEEDEGKDIAER